MPVCRHCSNIPKTYNKRNETEINLDLETQISHIELLRENFDRLMAHLRSEGFAITPTSYVHFFQIISFLESEETPLTRQQLKELLCPLVVRSETEQLRFGEIFDQIIPKEITETQNNNQNNLTEKNVPTIVSKTNFEHFLKAIKKYKKFVFFALAMVLAGLVYCWFYPYPSHPTPQIISTTGTTWNERIFQLDSLTRIRDSVEVKWFFGDGIDTTTSNKTLVRHRYPALDSIYAVSVLVNQRDSSLPYAVSIIKPTCQLFFEVDSIKKNTIYFRNTSVGMEEGTEYKWSFGDGKSQQTSDLTISHSYQNNKIYTISLSIIGKDCPPTNSDVCVNCSNNFNPKPFPLRATPQVESYRLFRWIPQAGLAIVIIGLGILIASIAFFLFRKLKGNNQLSIANKPPFSFEFQSQEGDIVVSDTLDLWARQMHQREAGDRREMDIKKSIYATIRTGGLPEARYKYPLQRPGYLVLIDDRSIYHQQARLYAFFTQALIERDVELETFFFHADPRFCWGEKYPRGVRIEDLQRIYANYNLVLVTEGVRLIDYKTGGVGEWFTEPLSSWSSRGILTPIYPQNWNYVEAILSQFFVVLPAIPKGQLLLRELLQRKPDNLPTFQELRQVLNADVQLNRDFFEKTANNISIGEIEAFLEQSFSDEDLPEKEKQALIQWAFATILYPTPQWDMTIAIGKEVERFYAPLQLVTSTHLLKITALPWLKGKEIPIELQNELRNRLDKILEHKVRRAILMMLENAKPQPQPDSYAHESWRSQMGQQWLHLTPTNAEESRQKKEVISDLRRYFWENRIENQELKKQVADDLKPTMQCLGALLVTSLLGLSLLIYQLADYRSTFQKSRPSYLASFYEAFPDSAVYFNNAAVISWKDTTQPLRNRYDNTLKNLVESVRKRKTNEAVFNFHALRYNLALEYAKGIFLPVNKNTQKVLDPADHEINTIIAPFRETSKNEWIPNEQTTFQYLQLLRNDSIALDSLSAYVYGRPMKEFNASRSNTIKAVATETKNLTSFIEKARKTYNPLVINTLLGDFTIKTKNLKLQSGAIPSSLMASLDSIETQRMLLYYGGPQGVLLLNEPEKNIPAPIINERTQKPRINSGTARVKPQKGSRTKPTTTEPPLKVEEGPFYSNTNPVEEKVEYPDVVIPADEETNNGIPNYGVLIGSVLEVTDKSGFYYLLVSANGTRYQVALNIDNQQNPKDPVIVSLQEGEIINEFAQSARSEGYYSLPKNSRSGALDYVRTKGLALNNSKRINSKELFSRLASTAKNGNMQVIVWGSRMPLVAASNVFNLPNGSYEIQNVHLNQGSQDAKYRIENAPWQDGAIIIVPYAYSKASKGPSLGVPNSSTAILLRFSSQTLNVDNDGNPTKNLNAQPPKGKY